MSDMRVYSGQETPNADIDIEELRGYRYTLWNLS